MDAIGGYIHMYIGCFPSYSMDLDSDEESRIENEELLPLKRQLAERAAAKQLDNYGYYL